MRGSRKGLVRRALRPPFVATFTVVGAALSAATGCGGSETIGGPGHGNPPVMLPDGSPDDVVPNECPPSAPTPSTPCSNPMASCNYSPTHCGGGVWYVCNGGMWSEQVSNPPAMVCPAMPPADGSPCSECGPTGCSWSVCGGVIQQAVCEKGKWAVEGISCNPPLVLDAGPGDDAAADSATTE